MGDSPTNQNVAHGDSGTLNSQTGYVPVDDENLHHSGLRGCKSCCVCTLVIVMVLVAIVNALVTAAFVYFLSITHEGMMSAEFLPETKFVRVLDDVHTEQLALHSKLVGPANQNMDLDISQITVGSDSNSKVDLDGESVEITTKDFKLTTAAGQELFSTKVPLNIELYKVTNLYASELEVGAITSLDGVDNLVMESMHGTQLMGTEGVQVEAGQNVELTAGTNAQISSMHGSLTVSTEEGLYLDTDLPVLGLSQNSGVETQLKLCVCMPTGKVFAIMNNGKGSGCHIVDGNKHPCED